MPTMEAKKRASQKYRDSVKHISLSIKKDTEKYNIINDYCINNNCSLPAVINGMIDYCIDNNIDIKSYIK